MTAALHGWGEMDSLVMKRGGWLLVALLALAAVAVSADWGFSVHMGIVAAAALVGLWYTLSRADYQSIAEGIVRPAVDQDRYDDDPVRWGVIATVFWGVAGLAAGLFIALQLA